MQNVTIYRKKELGSMTTKQNTEKNTKFFSGKIIRTLYLFAIGILVLTIIISLIISFSLSVGREHTESFYSAMYAFLVLLFSVILFVSCFLGGYYKTKQDIMFSASVFAMSVIFFLSALMSYVDIWDDSGKFDLIVNYLVAFFCTVSFVCFWFYQLETLPKTRLSKCLNVVIIILVVVYIALYMINIKTGILMYINLENEVEFPGLIVDLSFISAFEITYLIHVLFSKIKLKNKIIMSSYAFFPIVCVILNLIFIAIGGELYIFSVSYALILMACYIIFFNMFIEEKKQNLIREKQIAENEKMRVEMQTAIMMSQIQPHFLYNALTAIRVLCREDTARGDEAIVRFSHYLRQNMDSLQSSSPIPFEEELDHTKTYLMIEQMRFGDDLKIEYDIGCSNFRLPALTLQPLAENAVRHGICHRENGGTVIIRTERIGDKIHISVIDDGVGFDTSKEKNDGNTHIGLKNVRTRLRSMVNGELAVTSEVGKGTTATIILTEEKG